MKTIPVRTSSTSGSEFCKEHISTPMPRRETAILNEISSGNIPEFLRHFKTITIESNGNTIKYFASPDYLSIGSDDDYVRMPMNPLTAQAICNEFDFTLPTKKMVTDIWKQSSNKLEPSPWGPPYDSSMMSMTRVPIHSARIDNQLKDLDKTSLTSGHKKDVVLTNRLYPNNPNKRVAIFGWIKKSEEPIQGLNPVSHEDTYQDYSHGIRLIMNDVFINGKLARIQDIFGDANLSALISDEGPLKFIKY